jgi:hypothetical protein
MNSLVGVAGGATRAALIEHQARRNNLADVAAKDGSQETAIALLSLILGYVLTPYIDTVFLVCSCFILWLFCCAFSFSLCRRFCFSEYLQSSTFLQITWASHR